MAWRNALVGFGIVAAIGVGLLVIGFQALGTITLTASLAVGVFAWWATNDRG
jgi:hypothetical protein